MRTANYLLCSGSVRVDGWLVPPPSDKVESKCKCLSPPLERSWPRLCPMLPSKLAGYISKPTISIGLILGYVWLVNVHERKGF